MKIIQVNKIIHLMHSADKLCKLLPLKYISKRIENTNLKHHLHITVIKHHKFIRDTWLSSWFANWITWFTLPVKQVIRSSTAKPQQETENVNLNWKVIIYLPTTTLMPFSLASVRVLFTPVLSTQEKEQIRFCQNSYK
jgi:hypothetical protein